MVECLHRELSTLDLISCLADSSLRPLDFILVLQLARSPDIQALRLGARSARNLYPTTGSYICQKRWIRFSEVGDGISILFADSGLNIPEVIEQFVDRPFTPEQEMPVQQLAIVKEAGGVVLVTRFHHAAADGMSAILWLEHQLRVALGLETYHSELGHYQNLYLRTHSAPVKQSPFSFRRPSNRLWTSGSQPSRARRWRTITFNADHLRAGSRRIGEFTYNDLLVTCLLEILILWNLQNAHSKPEIGLWLPVNIRKDPSVGFGNGTSRIRLHARSCQKTCLISKCQSTRRQISWLCTHGEWAIPTAQPLKRLPFWALKPILRGYLNRPGIDMGTSVFSHFEQPRFTNSEVFKNVTGIDCIGLLHKRHCLAVNGSTHGSQTSLTFTYDPSLLTTADVDQLVAMYQEQIDRARAELKTGQVFRALKGRSKFSRRYASKRVS